MAIALDHDLGSTNVNESTFSGTLSLTLTTSAAAAAGSRVIVGMSYWAATSSQRVTGVTIGGTAATRDSQVVNADGQDVTEVWSLTVAGGLASSSSIVTSFGATSAGNGIGGVLIGASSWTGITGVDASASNTQTGTGWSSGSASNSVADALFFGVAGNECASTSEPGSITSGTQLHAAWNSSAGQGFKSGYVIASSIASQGIAGTWSNTSTATTGGLVIYKGTAAASGIPDLIAAPSHR